MLVESRVSYLQMLVLSAALSGNATVLGRTDPVSDMLRAGTRQGVYQFKLLAVDVPAASSAEQRLYVEGDAKLYHRGGVINELRDPFLQVCSPQAPCCRAWNRPTVASVTPAECASGERLCGGAVELCDHITRACS